MLKIIIMALFLLSCAQELKPYQVYPKTNQTNAVQLGGNKLSPELETALKLGKIESKTTDLETQNKIREQSNLEIIPGVGAAGINFKMNFSEVNQTLAGLPTIAGEDVYGYEQGIYVQYVNSLNTKRPSVIYVTSDYQGSLKIGDLVLKPGSSTQIDLSTEEKQKEFISKTCSELGDQCDAANAEFVVSDDQKTGSADFGNIAISMTIEENSKVGWIFLFSPLGFPVLEGKFNLENFTLESNLGIQLELGKSVSALEDFHDQNPNSEDLVRSVEKSGELFIESSKSGGYLVYSLKDAVEKPEIDEATAKKRFTSGRPTGAEALTKVVLTDASVPLTSSKEGDLFPTLKTSNPFELNVQEASLARVINEMIKGFKSIFEGENVRFEEGIVVASDLSAATQTKAELLVINDKPEQKKNISIVMNFGVDQTAMGRVARLQSLEFEALNLPYKQVSRIASLQKETALDQLPFEIPEFVPVVSIKQGEGVAEIAMLNSVLDVGYIKELLISPPSLTPGKEEIVEAIVLNDPTVALLGETKRFPEFGVTYFEVKGVRIIEASTSFTGICDGAAAKIGASGKAFRKALTTKKCKVQEVISTDGRNEVRATRFLDSPHIVYYDVISDRISAIDFFLKGNE